MMTKERRREQRNHVRDGVLYLHHSGDISEPTQNGLAFDVSKTGACIYTQNEFDEGETLKVFCKQFGNKPRTATVKWCKPLDENIYKIGLAFAADD